MLDDKVQEALDLVQEECAEIIQLISKIRRFGLASTNPYESVPRTNRRLLNDEVGDLTVLLRYLQDRDIIDEVSIEDRVKWKTEKLKKYTTLFSD